MARSVCLMGPPGSGKSTMVARTAINRPVHFLDIDNKIKSCGLDLPDVSAWALGEPLTEEPLSKRLQALVSNQRPSTAPLGWPTFAKMGDMLAKDPLAQKAGTWAVDSWTRLIDHLKRQILFLDNAGRSNLSPRNYGSLQGMQEETVSQLIDLAKAHGKDLMVTVHEQITEYPGPLTKIESVKTSQGDYEREYVGPMEVRISPSVEGSFRYKMLSYFDEAYALSVDIVNGKPVWKCRVLPDGRRDLRTALPVNGRAEFPPDFREVWSVAKGSNDQTKKAR